MSRFYCTDKTKVLITVHYALCVIYSRTDVRQFLVHFECNRNYMTGWLVFVFTWIHDATRDAMNLKFLIWISMFSVKILFLPSLNGLLPKLSITIYHLDMFQLVNCSKIQISIWSCKSFTLIPHKLRPLFSTLYSIHYVYDRFTCVFVCKTAMALMI